MPIDRRNPLGEEFTLGFVLLLVLTLDLKHEHLAPSQPDQEVGAVLLHDTLVDIRDLVAEVVVLNTAVGTALESATFLTPALLNAFTK